MDDHQIAAHLATVAGVELLALRRASPGAADLRARGDALGQRVLADLLREHRPQDAVLSEEAVDDPVRLSARRVWIIDPLDGTREYGDTASPKTASRDWAVHVALWADGDLVAGAVAVPELGGTFATPAVPTPSTTSPITGRLRVVVSGSRPPVQALAVGDALDAELVPRGSAGVKAIAVVTGEAHAYVHAGGQYEWDSAAPVAVARAAGLHTSRLDGSPLRYNRPDPSLPDLLICRPEIAEQVLAALMDHERWLQQFHVDAARVAQEDLSGEPEAW